MSLLLERFHTYVYARQGLTVQTDHQALIAISKKALASARKRLQRMLLRLQKYSFDVVYVRGSKLILADTASRASALTNAKQNVEPQADLAALEDEQQNDLQLIASQQTINELRAAAAHDPIYQQLKHQILCGWPPKQTDLIDDLKPYFNYRDELVVSGDFVLRRLSSLYCGSFGSKLLVS